VRGILSGEWFPSVYRRLFGKIAFAETGAGTTTRPVKLYDTFVKFSDLPGPLAMARIVCVGRMYQSQTAPISWAPVENDPNQALKTGGVDRWPSVAVIGALSKWTGNAIQCRCAGAILRCGWAQGAGCAAGTRQERDLRASPWQ